MRTRHGRAAAYAKTVAGMLMLILATVVAPPAQAAPDSSQSATIGQLIAVPAYFYPGGDGAALWHQLNQAAPQIGLAVANPFSGPGKTRDPNYAAAITAARAAGVKVLGYVATGYLGTTGRATRLGETTPAAWFAQVQQDIETWYDLYGADGLAGVFFDEVQNVCGPDRLYSDTYRSLDQHTRAWHRGAFTVINPGIDTERCYSDIGDVILTFEGTYESYLDWQPPSWHHDVDPRRLWHLIHATFDQTQLAESVRLSKQRNAGYLYVTPDVLANPWDSLPPAPYWSAQLTAALPGGRPDLTAPRAPGAPVPGKVLSTSARLSWPPAHDPGGRIVGYDVLLDGVRVAATTGATSAFLLSGLRPATSYQVAVVARDAAGNISAPSPSTRIVTRPGDAHPPAVPDALRAVEVKVASVRLSWTADPEVVDYEVYRDGVRLLDLPSRLFMAGGAITVPVSGLEPGTGYEFAVRGRDLSGNVSQLTVPLLVSTAVPSGDPITEAGGSIGATAVDYHARYNLPFDFHHVFIDVDNDASTGFGTAGVGADLLIENGWFYQHTGTGWSWTPVAGPSPLVSATDDHYLWRVPVSLYSDLFGSPIGEHRVVFHGAGGSPEVYSAVTTVN